MVGTLLCLLLLALAAVAAAVLSAQRAKAKVRETESSLQAVVEQRKHAEDERAHAVEELQAMLRARNDFLAATSHDLKTPLTALRLQIESLVRQAQSDVSWSRKIGPGLDRAARSIARMAQMVDSLLDLSRIQSGTLQLKYEDLNAVDVATDVVDRFGAQLAWAGCNVHLHARMPVWGRWDRLRVEQILTNLLSNAMKYAHEKPIDLDVESDDGTARIRMRDHGPGISAEDQSRIFGRFERGSERPGVQGLGLGLWIVRQVAQAMHGRVWVESRIGEGATFTVELPIAAQIDAGDGNLSHLATGTPPPS